MRSFLCGVVFAVLSGCAGSNSLIRWADASQPTCVSNVRVFDGRQETLSEPMTVVWKGGRITELSPMGEPSSRHCIDGTGKTLVPGLIDSHVHLGLSSGHAPWDLRLPDPKRQVEMLLYSGVTTALVAGGSPDAIERQAAIERGDIIGPTLLRASSIMTAVDGHPLPMLRSSVPGPLAGMVSAPLVIEVADEAAVPRAMARALTTKPDFVKIVYDDIPPQSPHLTPETLAALIHAANRNHVRAIVHVGAPREALEAAERGASLLMHVPWEHAFTEEEATRLAELHVPLVTTRRIHLALTEMLAGRTSLHSLEKEVCPDALPAIAQRPANFELQGLDAKFEALLGEWDRTLAANVLLLRAHGVTLLAGTDSGLPAVFQGASLHRELQLLVADGWSTADALRSATSIPAGVLAPERKVGVIEVGAEADLLLVEGDPLADISVLERIQQVWKAGKPVERVAPR